VHRIRAAAALTAFLNTLAASLFALIPGHMIGPTAVAAGGSGILFIMAALLSLVRLRQVRWSTVRDALFLAGLTVAFVFQILQGADLLDRQSGDGGIGTSYKTVVSVGTMTFRPAGAGTMEQAGPQQRVERDG
jgi:hypothetical protein